MGELFFGYLILFVYLCTGKSIRITTYDCTVRNIHFSI